MFSTTSVASHSRWSVGVWALLLSMTAATLAAVLGIHTLGDNAFSGGVQAASSVTQSVPAEDSSSGVLPAVSMSTGGDIATAITDDGGALACTILALLCIVTLAVVLLRMRGAAARALDPLAGPGAAEPAVATSYRVTAMSLTVLGVSRI